MPQLVAPSVALTGTFLVPPLDSLHEPEPQAETARAFTAYAVVVGNLGLLLPTDTVSTLIEEGLPFCPLPNTPPWLRGMANYYGNVIPIFDLETLLELPASVRAESKILLIGEGETAVGITVVSPPVRLRLSSAQVLTGSPPLPPVLQPYVRACYRSEGIWVDWDMRAFFIAAGERI